MFSNKIYLMFICYHICLGMADNVCLLDVAKGYKYAKFTIAHHTIILIHNNLMQITIRS